jgi:hypothetical protein
MTQVAFNPRVHFLVHCSEIFKYEGYKLENNSTENLLYEITKQRLIAGFFPEEPKKLLNHLHWYTPAKNAYGRRRKVSFIRHLIEKACAESEGREECKTKLHIPNPTTITGIDSESELKSLIELIDTIWYRNKIAAIRYDNGHIYFEIFRRS